MTRVALLRLPTGEISLLRNMFDVVATRGISYEMAETNEEIATAELVVVDADSNTALSLWTTLQHERPGVVGILLSRSPEEGDGQIWIQRPLNSMKVLSALGRADLKRNPTRLNKRGAGGGAGALQESRSMKGARVLVIDDSATVRKQLEIALNDQGVHVQCADTGEAGLHLLSMHNFDLIFLDVVMPGADGYQICRTVKKNKLKQRVPVVMLTSKSSPFDRVKGSLAGCDSYLTKPVELRRLLEVLQKHLQRRDAAAERADSALVGDTARVRAIEI